MKVKHPSRALRSNGSILPQHPGIRSSKTLGDRSFSIAAPTEWNILPPQFETRHLSMYLRTS